LEPVIKIEKSPSSRHAFITLSKPSTFCISSINRYFVPSALLSASITESRASGVVILLNGFLSRLKKSRFSGDTPPFRSSKVHYGGFSAPSYSGQHFDYFTLVIESPDFFKIFFPFIFAYKNSGASF